MDMQSLGSGLEVNAVLVQKGEVGGKELLVHAQGAPMLEATPLTIYPLRHFFSNLRNINIQTVLWVFPALQTYTAIFSSLSDTECLQSS